MVSRISAVLIHLCASAGLALATFCLVYFVWYPSPLAQATGILNIFVILLIVDVVLGPVLTGVVFKAGKKSLRFDLTVIVLVQLAALSYGLWTIAAGRPAWLVFNADRVDLVQTHELDDRHLAQTAILYRHAPWTGPRWVASVNPVDVQERNALVMESSMGGPDLPQRIDLYRPIEQEVENIRAKSHPMAELLRYNPAAAVQKAQSEWPQADAWLPLMANARSMAVLVRKQDGKIIAVVDLRPWN